MFSIKLKVEFDSKSQALRFFKSIKPELEEEYLRSKTRVSQKENVLDFLITASDKTALRASLNSITKPLKLFEMIEEL
ncbi:MAG: KEOPS complex subunit Pcc1 [Candidatus Iainarchaeum sp.]|jgi:tRNA threonylcarbamoyladenosine modification (KEOPS) complex  Pcc1 subunit|nr:MAG: Transcription factor Pcc1 [archaeon ADurb.Bin336]